MDETGEGYGDPTGKIDAFGHAAKLGVIESVAATIENALRIRPRFDKPGYLQRSFAELISPVDREEAYQAGVEGVKAACAGATGQMISFERLPGSAYAIAYRLQDLSQIANEEKKVPGDYINASGNDVTEAFLAYARPLIGGPLPPYGRLAMHPVPRL